MAEIIKFDHYDRCSECNKVILKSKLFLCDKVYGNCRPIGHAHFKPYEITCDRKLCEQCLIEESGKHYCKNKLHCNG